MKMTTHKVDDDEQGGRGEGLKLELVVESIKVRVS